MDFLKNLTQDEHRGSDTQSYSPIPIPATKRDDSGDSIFERFADKLNISDAQRPAPPAPEPKSLFDKLGDAVDGLSGKKTPPPPPPPRPESLLDKISDVLQAGKHDEPPKAQSFGDKIGDKFNNMLGGGAAGEAKEDHLDKAVDFVQEHILKEGQQKNESVVEQVKDKEIANAIRHGFESLTGKRN